jgi:type VI secretion system protein ImpA
MPTSNQLDLAMLLAPIPGNNPAGANIPFGVKDQLEQMRKEVDPSSYDANDPLRPTEFRKADWGGIVSLGTKTLTQTSKDLQTAARMVEALTKLRGFQGLGDGLELLDGLIDQAWDRLVPVVDDPSDLDIRAAPFEWLDDPDRGARFPSTVGGITLLDATKEVPSMGYLDWKQGQSSQGTSGAGKFDQILSATSLEVIQTRHDLVLRAREILGRLTQRLSDKLKDLAPSMVRIRTMLDQCEGLLAQIIAKKSPVQSASPAAGDQAASGSVSNSQAMQPNNAGSRQQAYQMLANAADILASIEPHSPVPYLIRRAVELGRLPFPELIQAFVREQNVLETMFRELGIEKKEPS